MEYRKFQSLFGSKWGKWKKIHDPDRFHLHLSVENYSYRVPMITSPAFSSGSTVKNKSITYNVTVHTKSDQQIDVFEFASYKMALKLASQLRALESVEVIDHIALKLEENQYKRMNRRR